MKKILLVFVLLFTIVSTNTLALAQETKVAKPTGSKFSDTSKHWAAEAIERVADKDVFADKDGKFKPGKAITRSEFVMMLYKALGIQIMYFKAPDITEHFDDVKNEDIYAAALNDLVTANIIDDKGKFRPSEPLPREDMVHYIINSLEYMTGGNYALIKMLPQPFDDDKDIKPAYKYDFVKAQLLQLVKGKGKNLFHPKDNTTRAEAAVVIYRLLNVLEKLNDDVQVNPSAETGKDGMVLKLMIANNSKNTITINHSSGQKYDFELLDANKNALYRWSADKSFIMALGTTVLEPGKSIEFSAEVEDSVFNDVKGKAVSMKRYIVGTSDEFTVNEDGYEAEVKWN